MLCLASLLAPALQSFAYPTCNKHSIDEYMDMKKLIKTGLAFALVSMVAPLGCAFARESSAPDFAAKISQREAGGKVGKADKKNSEIKDAAASSGRQFSSGKADYPTLGPVPKSVFQAAENKGRVETFSYKVEKDGKKFEKQAQVYLPFGYDGADKSIKYNVVYLMHGGGDDAGSFFSDKRGPLPLTRVLDHLIEDGKMSPIIVVAPTFYDKPGARGGMQDAVRQTRDFHLELQDFLIPALESHYNTHLSGRDRDCIKRSRAHRAYGGFSMGALSAWYQLAFGLDAAKYIIPLSGDLWVYDENNRKIGAAEAAQWLGGKISESEFAGEFKVFAYTGTKDIAYEPQKSLITSLFELAPLFNEKNLSFKLKENGVHYYGDINEYLYDALPLIWGNRRK